MKNMNTSTFGGGEGMFEAGGGLVVVSRAAD
jgi:hypothetical protein